jgi:hypothetical protein
MLHLDSTPPHGENERDPPARGKITETARRAPSPALSPSLLPEFPGTDATAPFPITRTACTGEG